MRELLTVTFLGNVSHKTINDPFVILGPHNRRQNYIVLEAITIDHGHPSYYLQYLLVLLGF